MIRLRSFMAVSLGAACAALPAAAAEAQTSRRGPQPALAEPAVQACPEQGPGFFRVAGSMTCIRVSGQVRAEMSFGSARSGSWGGGPAAIAPAPSVRTHASGRVMLDARTQTPLGTVRAVVRTPRMGKERDFR
jgi:hypothetical protein